MMSQWNGRPLFAWPSLLIMSLDLHLRGVYQFSRYFSQFYCNSRFHNICIDFRCRSLLMQLPLIEEMCSNLCPSRSIIQKMMVKNLIEFVNKFYKFPHTHRCMYRKPIAFWICIAIYSCILYINITSCFSCCLCSVHYRLHSQSI